MEIAQAIETAGNAVPAIGEIVPKLPESDRARLASTLENSKALKTLYAMRQELTALWERSNDSREQLLARLQDWCHRADASGIVPLQNFSRRLRTYA